MQEERLAKAAEISVFAHATEDKEKVKQAVKRIAPYEHVFESQLLSGHYEDPITLITSRTTKKKEATDLLANIIRKLSSLDKQTLFNELPNHVDPQGNLYLRFDKQRAFHGRVSLQENDSIHVKIKFRLPHKADPVAVIKECLINLEEDTGE